MQIQGDPSLTDAHHGHTPKLHPVQRCPSGEDGESEGSFASNASDARSSVVEIARCFLQLPANSFALLGRYEASLWRQVRQTIVTLERKHRLSAARNWRQRAPWRTDL